MTGKKLLKWLCCPLCGSKNLNLERDKGPEKPGDVIGGECLACKKYFTLERGTDGQLYADADSQDQAPAPGPQGGQAPANGGEKKEYKPLLCNKCQAEIRFLKVVKDGVEKAHPVEPTAVVLLVSKGTQNAKGEYQYEYRKGYISHFASCPAAQEYRNKHAKDSGGGGK